ncbi:UNVERIFIED_CONTAM: hypothetical protein Sradi_3580300 [Sesamum radiatum]|uniref:Uncharacterized protein n=1 Tax=Sesamum radiatum TaxID=300843 RepID=A0AAW2QHG9_SESRA
MAPYGCRGWSMVLAHGVCSGTLFGFLPEFSLNLVPSNVGVALVWKYALSLIDDPVEDHWQLYSPPALVGWSYFIDLNID